MNYRMIGYVLSRIFLIEAGLLLLPAAVGLYYGDSAVTAFFITIAILVIAALLCGVRQPENSAIYAREGFVIVAIAWMGMSLFGALPFTLSGSLGYVDALFETVSGFTTTGSSLLTDVEGMQRSLLFWRSFTHWVGGMGVLVFLMAVLPMKEGRTMHIMRAEMPGPTVGKLSSKVRDTAKTLYLIYMVMTVLEMILLRLGGMPWFDSVVHSFGTAGTGGFSIKSQSIGAYNSLYIEIVIGVFMLLFGVNFNLYYFLLVKRFREVLKSEELRTYLIMIAGVVLGIALNIRRLYDGFGTALRLSFFQTASIVTTTGYGTADFNLWPMFSKVVLVLLMFCGGCAGSTAGGFKLGRVMLLLRSAASDLKKMVHPHAVTVVRFEGQPVDEKTIQGVHMYTALYMMILFIATLILSFDPNAGDLVTCVTSVITCLNNIGPGLSLVGPAGNFSFFSPWSKVLLSLVMLFGRLEILPMLLIFVPSVWSRKRNVFRE